MKFYDKMVLFDAKDRLRARIFSRIYFIRSKQFWSRTIYGVNSKNSSMRITSPVILVGSILESIIGELLGVTGLLEVTGVTGFGVTGLLEVTGVTGFGVTELVEVTGVTGLVGLTGLTLAIR
jgi:hypothetical protein